MKSKILWRLHVSNQVGSVVTNKVTTDPSWFVSLRSLHSQGIQSRAHAEEKFRNVGLQHVICVLLLYYFHGHYFFAARRLPR